MSTQLAPRYFVYYCNMALRFLDLPVEVRLMIYKIAFQQALREKAKLRAKSYRRISTKIEHTVWIDEGNSTISMMLHSPGRVIPLLQTCKTI